MKLRDNDVRMSLHQEIKMHFSYDRSTHVVDELQICNGAARIDVAAINGALHGYEIKSESDTLVRLPSQIEHYNKVFDYMYFVCADNQFDKAQSIIPQWWGIYLVTNINGLADLNLVRQPQKNENIDAFSLLQFLNKDELVAFGKKYELGSPAAFNRMQKYRLWQIFAAKVDSDEIDINDLSDYLRLSIKTREGGRTHLLQM